MKYLNKVELVGYAANPKIMPLREGRCCQFLLATNYVYRNPEGYVCYETAWHNVTAFEGKAIKDVDTIVKGANVRVLGRIRYAQFNSDSGEDYRIAEIVASKVQIITEKL